MRKHSRPFLAPAVLLTVFLSIPLATAQITTGVISGVVVDEKGEPLPGVLITARNPETGYEQAVTSDSEGKYKFLAMQPAVYVLQATMEGYGAPLKTIVVNIGQITRANFALAPGAGLKEKVTVTSAPPLLNTTKSEVSTVVTEEEVRSYPLVQRDFNDLATLAPGVKTAPSGQFDPTKKQQIYSPYTTGGTAGRNINISIDGADNNDNVVGFFVQGFSTRRSTGDPSAASSTSSRSRERTTSGDRCSATTTTRISGRRASTRSSPEPRNPRRRPSSTGSASAGPSSRTSSSTSPRTSTARTTSP